MSSIKKGKDAKIEITPIPLPQEEFREVEHSIFQIPMMVCGIGSVRSGKTTTLIRLVEQLEPIFKGNVILWSPTFKNDAYHKYAEDKDLFLEIFDHFDNATLQSVLDVIKDDEEVKDEGGRYLLLFDDIVGLLPNQVMSHDHKAFANFITTYRHGGHSNGIEGSISVMLFTQYYKDLSPIVRMNCSIYLFLGTHSSKELNKFAEELSAATNGDENKFIELYNEVKKDDPYNIMVLDMRKLRVYKNFDTLIHDSLNKNN